MNESLKFAENFFGKRNIETVTVAGINYNKRKKLIVFIPDDYADSMTFKLAGAGAGVIGKYTLCSFRTAGTGTFRGDEGTAPYIGTKQKFEKADEVRLEMICDEERLDDIIDAMYSEHPYEEPAYEIYDISVRSGRDKADAAVIRLKKALDMKDILKKAKVNVDMKLIGNKILKTKIRNAAIDRTGSVEETLKKHLPSKGKSIYISNFAKNTINIKLY